MFGKDPMKNRSNRVDHYHRMGGKSLEHMFPGKEESNTPSPSQCVLCPDTTLLSSDLWWPVPIRAKTSGDPATTTTPIHIRIVLAWASWKWIGMDVRKWLRRDNPQRCWTNHFKEVYDWKGVSVHIVIRWRAPFSNSFDARTIVSVNVKGLLGEVVLV